jgi:hypothetical protein
MSGQENFGPLLDVLIACVGALDAISLFAYMYNETYGKSSTLTDINNNDVRVRDKSDAKSAHNNLSYIGTGAVPKLVIDSEINDGDVIDTLVSKVNELEAKVTELEVKSREGSMERFVDRERYRRSRSPSPSPHSHKISMQNYDESDGDDGKMSHGEGEHYPSRIITRDDEFRKTIKRSSQTSQHEHEAREQELEDLTRLEAEEMSNMDDAVIISYGDITDDTIDEDVLCPIHGNAVEIERSPEPGMAAIVEKPWCDIRKNVGEIQKDEKRAFARRSESIEEKLEDVAVDVNENFLKIERVDYQQQSARLVKQGKVESEEFPEESAHERSMPNTNDLPLPQSVDDSLATPIQNESYAHVAVTDFKEESVSEIPPPTIVEVINEPQSVAGSLMEVNINSISGGNNLQQTFTPPSISDGSSSNFNLNISTSSLHSGNVSLASSAVDNVMFIYAHYTP